MKTKYCLLALLWPVANLFAQTDMNGVVHTQTHAPVPNVTVTLMKSGTRTLTNASGVFIIGLRQPNDTLVVTATGYRRFALPVTSYSGFLDISLTEQAEELDEVVVVGYGTTTPRTNTGSIAVISSQDISKQPVANPLAALEGRVAGLNIVQSNGVPGATFSVQVRGQSSLTQGSDPLFVIDGVPYAPNNTPASSVSSAASSFSGGVSPFSSLNPADIESITILKDADATAIYGSRGANGVVLITTKKGKSGQTSFTLTAYSGVSFVRKPTELLKTPDYLRARREALANDGVVPDAANAPDLLLWDTTRYTNYPGLLTGGTARTTDVQASLTGGTAGTQFLVSGSYHRETTVYPSDGEDKRGTVHLSVTHTSENKKLSLTASAMYSSEGNTLPSGDLTGYTRLAPNTPSFYDSTGALSWSESEVPFNNPLSYLLQTYRAGTDNLTGNVTASYRVLPSLVLRASAGYNTYRLTEVNTNPATSQNPQYQPMGYSFFGSRGFHSYIVEPQAEYSYSQGKLKLTVLAGGSFQNTTSDGNTLFAYGYANDQLLKSLSAAPSLLTLSETQTEYRYAAAFGRVTAGWKERYLLNLSGRRDGSSRFGPGKQFANFGAAGGGWIFSRETWISRHLPFLSFGKLRGSYGVTGNDQIGDYNYLNTWSPTPYPYNGSAGLYPTRLFNPYYRWETNRKGEAGLELGFLRDRLLLSTDYFINRSSNQLLSYTLPAQTGFTGILNNFPATVQNSGWEAVLTTRNLTGALTWTTTVNLTIPRNKLASFPGIESTPYASQYEVGQPLHVARGLVCTGVDPATGVFMFSDENKDGVLDEQDYRIIARLDPTYYGGIGNSFSRKRWSLDVFFQFKKQTGQNEYASLYSPYATPPGTQGNFPSTLPAHWQKPGDVAPLQRLTATPGTDAYAALYNFASSSGIYSDASFIRLKTVSLSYTIPARTLSRKGLKGCRVYAQGQNLLTFSRYKGSDPETQNLNTLPPLTTITGGIQLNF